MFEVEGEIVVYLKFWVFELDVGGEVVVWFECGLCVGGGG